MFDSPGMGSTLVVNYAIKRMAYFASEKVISVLVEDINQSITIYHKISEFK